MISVDGGPGAVSRPSPNPGLPTPDQGEGKRCYKVLFLLPGLNSYGVAKATLSLACGLINRGHSVHCASQADEDVVKEWVSRGVCFVPVPFQGANRSPGALWSVGQALARLLQRERFDVIHSHHRQTTLIAKLLRPWRSCPVVTTCHGILQGRRALSAWGMRVICVSQDTQQHLVRRFGVKPERAVVIHNGIDLGSWAGLSMRGLAHAPKRPDEPFTVTSLARLSPEKDLGTLLKAMSMVIVTFPRARVWLAGTGELESELKALARTLGIGHAVRFLGLVSDVRPILAATDVFVLSSTTEGLPMSLLEALAAGVPVVATRVGGIPTVVKHRETGCLVPACDARLLADEITYLFQHPQQAREMCIRGREVVEREFSVARMARETERVYQSVIEA